MGRKAKADDMVREKMTAMFDGISKSVNEITKSAKKGDDLEGQLEELAKEFQYGTVKIYRRERNSNRLQLFTEFEYPLDEFLMKGPDSLCRTYGGGGDYKVKLFVPGDKAARLTYNDISIAGPSRDIPKNDVPEGMAGLQPYGMSPVSTPFNFGGPPAQAPMSTRKESSDEVVKQMARQYERQMADMQNANDRFAMMMMQNQQQTMALLTGFFQNQRSTDQPSAALAAESSKVAALESKIEKMLDESRAEKERTELRRQIDELKQAIAISNSSQKSGGDKDWILPVIAQMSGQSQNSTQTLVEMMKMLQNKPHESEMFGNLLATVSNVVGNSLEGQLGMMKMMKELNSEGEPSGKDFLWKGMEGIFGLAQQMLEAKATAAQYEDDDEEEERQAPPAMMAQAPMPALFQQPAPAMAGLPEHQAEESAPEREEEPEEVEEEMEETIDLLSEEELDQLDRDSALQKAIASLMNGDHVSEATVRIYRHMQSGNRIARKWYQYPYDVTEQILGRLDALTLQVQNAKKELVEIDLVNALGDDIVAFHSSKDKENWAKTGYNPWKKRPAYVDPVFKDSGDVKNATKEEKSGSDNATAQEEEAPQEEQEDQEVTEGSLDTETEETQEE